MRIPVRHEFSWESLLRPTHHTIWNFGYLVLVQLDNVICLFASSILSCRLVILWRRSSESIFSLRLPALAWSYLLRTRFPMRKLVVWLNSILSQIKQFSPICYGFLTQRCPAASLILVWYFVSFLPDFPNVPAFARMFSSCIPVGITCTSYKKYWIEWW